MTTLSATRIGPRDTRDRITTSPPNPNMPTPTQVIGSVFSVGFCLASMMGAAADIASPSSVDGERISFGLLIFVAALAGAIGFTWSVAQAWFRVTAKLQRLERSVSELQHTRRDHGAD